MPVVNLIRDLLQVRHRTESEGVLIQYSATVMSESWHLSRRNCLGAVQCVLCARPAATLHVTACDCSGRRSSARRLFSPQHRQAEIRGCELMSAAVVEVQSSHVHTVNNVSLGYELSRVLVQVLPDDRPHVDLVLRRLKKIHDAEGCSGAADAQKTSSAPTTAPANGTTDPPARAGSAGKPAHVLFDMEADLELALRLSAAEAEAAERRAAGTGPLVVHMTLRVIFTVNAQFKGPHAPPFVPSAQLPGHIALHCRCSANGLSFPASIDARTNRPPRFHKQMFADP